MSTMATGRMVPSLRSLCLEKVNTTSIDEVDYQRLPKELARDLQLIKLFNGNFTCFTYEYLIGIGMHDWTYDDELACALNIFYDGETWIFTYRSENIDLYYHHPPGEFRPRLRKFTLTEGSPVIITTPFPEMKYDMTTNRYLRNPNNKMKMKAIVKNNGRYGRLVFENSNMKSIWHMTLDKGVRVLEHRGTVRYCYPTSCKFRETTVSPEHAFQEFAELTIEDEIRLDAACEESAAQRIWPFTEVEVDVSLWTESEYRMDVGCLSDFWEMVERNNSSN